jgi:zona occludens toxin (predicted ATPase)
LVTQFRSRPGVIEVGASGGERLGVRVQLADRWDTIACDTRADAPVSALKREALARFGIAGAAPADFSLKLRGIEVPDEQVSVADSGARDGSTFFLDYRRRRPVR